mmetsp:Transcript_33578/g.106819  ORF Transcript_33578/g.106819 Transcript_33578/m.106819 type:complete len:206 (+) Transcript_33578:41-658(+)
MYARAGWGQVGRLSRCVASARCLGSSSNLASPFLGSTPQRPHTVGGFPQGVPVRPLDWAWNVPSAAAGNGCHSSPPPVLVFPGPPRPAFLEFSFPPPARAAPTVPPPPQGGPCTSGGSWGPSPTCPSGSTRRRPWWRAHRRDPSPRRCSRAACAGRMPWTWRTAWRSRATSSSGGLACTACGGGSSGSGCTCSSPTTLRSAAGGG